MNLSLKSITVTLAKLPKIKGPCILKTSWKTIYKVKDSKTKDSLFLSHNIIGLIKRSHGKLQLINTFNKGSSFG
jgi:hypothetical protein